ncbi:uncharacterized protein FFB20_00311 [Fusarium fujikuroi]|uniref:C2H2-type domain-containing protein n=2 Tax=Fusarium fujikuroi TaxID=5127 RepID=S0E741_GIBF5|nr:uncharacterized protein FFUJ_07115 [Fusarium fujikuroi IMI 58289]KLP07701.1 uncharacterized protein LW94_1336 [Fusarium fujikuroi]KLP08021.1 uncharacterized protein Y057_11313 [Fusarium fujikuroi]QGI64268.1 hypothetical protein CEK27_008239 [Fusarium fujikuroi]QGI81532.1 hypothetical protein CEK25_008261 [Fusarium fujikuroi]QGI95153.1 hypothetical protein CEK26_008222 [Fusarium fujikuroi]
MSDSVDSTNPGGAGTGDAPPTKSSLKSLEAARTGVANPEEVSLFGICDGQGDPYTGFTWEQMENNAPQTGVPSLHPLGMIQARPAEAMSSSEPSQSGPSYTAPAHSVSNASNLHLEEDIQSLIDHPKVKHSLSWIPEFSWHDSHLLFDGQPLELPETRDGQLSRGGPSSEHGLSLSQWSVPQIREPDCGHERSQISAILGVGSFVNSDKHWDEKPEVASEILSVSTDISLSVTTFKGEFIEAGLPAQVEIALQKTVNNIVEILVDYYCRSYAPQKQSLAAKRKLADKSSSTSTKSSRASIKRKGAKPGSRKGQAIDGDGESEDEESSGNRQSPSETDTPVEQILFLACPFMKWNPREYRHSCIKKLRDMHGLKKHIQEKHFVNHCPKCFMRPSEDTKVIPPHPCIEMSGLSSRPTAGLITVDMQAAIKERPGARLPQKEKWERLFKIIFPQEPIPSSPYLDHEVALFLCEIDKFVCQPSVKHRIRGTIQESQLEHCVDSLWQRIDELVLERLVPEILDVLNSNVIGMNACLASDQITVDHAQSISTLERGIPGNLSDFDSRGFGSGQNESATIHSGVLTEVDDATTPIPTPFANQPDIGVWEISTRPEATDTYGLFCPDVAGITNFEAISSGPFSSPGVGHFPWYGEQEMFEMEPEQARGDEILFQWP